MKLRTQLILAAVGLTFGLANAHAVSAERDGHEVTITGDVSCANKHGDYTVAWTFTSDDDGTEDTWSIGGEFKPITEPFHAYETHNVDEGPGVEIELLFTWSNGEEIGRSQKLPAGEPCIADSVPDTAADTVPDTVGATDVATTAPNTTTAPTIGEIPGPATVSTTTTIPPTTVVTETPVQTTIPLGGTLPKTGTAEGVALIVAGIIILIGGSLLLARGPRRP